MYEETEAKIKNGDVAAFKGRTFFSYLIIIATWMRVTHVGIFRWSDGILEVLESIEGVGVRVYPLEAYLRAGHEVDWHSLDTAKFKIDRVAVVKFFRDHWRRGTKYAPWWQFLRSWGFATSRVCNALGIPINIDKSRFFCSEIVMAALKTAGYSGEGYRRNPAKVSPGDVVELPCLGRQGRLWLTSDNRIVLRN